MDDPLEDAVESTVVEREAVVDASIDPADRQALKAAAKEAKRAKKLAKRQARKGSCSDDEGRFIDIMRRSPKQQRKYKSVSTDDNRPSKVSKKRKRKSRKSSPTAESCNALPVVLSHDVHGLGCAGTDDDADGAPQPMGFMHLLDPVDVERKAVTDALGEKHEAAEPLGFMTLLDPKDVDAAPKKEELVSFLRSLSSGHDSEIKRPLGGKAASLLGVADGAQPVARTSSEKKWRRLGSNSSKKATEAPRMAASDSSSGGLAKGMSPRRPRTNTTGSSRPSQLTPCPALVPQSKAMGKLGIQDRSAMAVAMMESDSEENRSRSKLMQMMGLGEQDLAKAEEETAKLMASGSAPLSAKKRGTLFKKKSILIDDSSSAKRKCERRAYKQLRESGNSEEVGSQMEEALETAILLFSLNGINNVPEESPRAGDFNVARIIANDFMKQGTSLWSTGLRKSQMVDAAVPDSAAAPMGLGFMHINFDRWWDGRNFTGDAYFSGCFFTDEQEVVTSYLQYLHGVQMGTMLTGTFDGRFHRYSLKYVQDVTHTSDLRSLEAPKLFQEFIGKVTEVSCGYHAVALVSELGEIFISAAKGHSMATLARAMCPDDWRGTLFCGKLLGRRVKQVMCGPFYFVAITDNNEVVTWGLNSNPRTGEMSGHLGHAASIFSSPRLITGFEGKPLLVAGGMSHIVVLTSTGVYTCGANEMGQLGYDVNQDSVGHLLPVPGLLDKFGVACVVASVSCGLDHTVVSTEDGLVFSWGANHFGQLGREDTVHFVTSPTRVDSISSIISVRCGATHSLALATNGTVYTFGSNSFGELGADDLLLDARHKPKPVLPSTDGGCMLPNFVGVPVKIFAGGYSSGLITNQGVMYVWGLLQDSNLTQHIHAPRLSVEHFFAHRFLVDAGLGITNTIVRTDATLSKAVAAVVDIFLVGARGTGGLSEEETRGVQQLLHQLKSPSRTFAYIMKRALSYLYLVKKRSPKVTCDREFVSFTPLGLTSTVVTENIVVTNSSDRNVVVTLSLGDLVENHKQQVLLEPSKFKLAKKGGKQEVQLTFVSTRPVTTEIPFLVCVSTGKKGSSSLDSLIYCRVLPAHGRRVSLAGEADSYDATQYVRALSTYVPSVLIKQFALDPNPPRKPAIGRFPAAILFLDISGFTSLNERLAQLGPAGPELVSKHINSYFASLIQVVSEHGGDVLKFAGDALICMFYDACEEGADVEGSESLESLTLRAVQCGFDIQTRLAKYDSNEGFSLTLHIGIGSGSILSLYVGSIGGSWEYLVSGEPLAQLRTAVDNSKSGEVVVSAESWELIKLRCTGEPRDNDFWVKSITETVPVQAAAPISNWPRPEAEAALRCFIPLAVQRTVDSQQLAGWGDELRVATVLFVKLNTHIPDETNEIYLESINDILSCMQSVVFKYEGMVRQFLADDKGTVLIAAFGLPPFSHEDDPIRGLKTALEIHAELLLRGMDCSIGVTTGQVFCGSVGCPMRQEYAMVGDVVNLSARLMVAAFKQKKFVLCDHRTYAASNVALSFEPLEPIKVKGKSMAIAIYRPLTESEQRGTKQQLRITGRYLERIRPILGRDGVRKAIEDHILDLNNTTLRRDHGTIVIEGDKGMGKTLLANYAASMCKFSDIKICHGAADMIQKTTSLYAWRTVVGDLVGLTSFGQDDVADSEALLTRLEEEMQGVWFDYVPLLQDLLPIDVPENDLTSSLKEKERKTHLCSLVKHMLQNYTLHGSVLLILEDLQWMDSDSIHLLLDIVGSLSSVFIVVTIREGAATLSSRISQLLTQPNVEHYHLQPLSEANMAAIAKEVLGVHSLPQEVVDIIKKARGNPMFCQEIAAGLQDSDFVDIEEGVLTVTGNLDQLQLPALETVIKTQLDRLGSDRQMVLKVASVIGFTFDLETLLHVFPIEKSEKKFIPAELETLERQGFVVLASGDARQQSYQFASLTILKVAYSRLTFAQRAKLHESIAKWYQQFTPIRALDSRIAYHLLEVIEGQSQPEDALLLLTIEHALSAAQLASKQMEVAAASEWRGAALQLARQIADEEERLRATKEVRLQIMGGGHWNEGISMSLSTVGVEVSDLKLLVSRLRILSGVAPM